MGLVYQAEGELIRLQSLFYLYSLCVSLLHDVVCVGGSTKAVNRYKPAHPEDDFEKRQLCLRRPLGWFQI